LTLLLIPGVRGHEFCVIRSRILRGCSACYVDFCEVALGFLVAAFARANLLVVCASTG